jgi:hypothetical protein
MEEKSIETFETNGEMKRIFFYDPEGKTRVLYRGVFGI